jgi:hypothetical protein
MALTCQEALKERARNLEAAGLNGIRMALVTLYPDPNPTEARITLHFHNHHGIDHLLAADHYPYLIKLSFDITGGHRLPAGPATGQVKVTGVTGNPGDTFLTLTVAPIGDYSTYILIIDDPKIDPVFSEIPFKFRPGCVNLCGPDWLPAPAPLVDPTIDYLAKDYESFRHTMITAMMGRVPGWQPSSEADLDQVLLELFSAAADELSDYQDRVMNEAYLGTARKRVSLARHARLMDYHIHQGNQASTWLAVELQDGQQVEIPKANPIPPGQPIQLLAWAGKEVWDPAAVVFMSRETRHLHYLVNRMGLYTWSDSRPALERGCTGADLQLVQGGPIPAYAVRDLIFQQQITHLLIQEWLNPATGEQAGRNPAKRQLLKLKPGEVRALQDPLTGKWLVRVRWEDRDKLKADYCFTVDCPEGKVEDVSLFHGNLLQVYAGRPQTGYSQPIVFKEPGKPLAGEQEFYYQRPEIERPGRVGTKRWGTVCRLPDGPLAYKDTPPGGEVPPDSTLQVQVDHEQWQEVISLVRSDDSEVRGNHFIVETDEEGRSLIRFGNGVNGRELPDQAEVHCFYQVGRGPEGNIGQDALVHFDQVNFPQIASCWNPFDVTNGRPPEPVEEILRRVPEAYRAHQLRAVTLKDYVARAEELAEVSRAAARYAWTGSWRTVQIAIDPVGTTILSEELRREIAQYLEAVRLIGEDLEIRPPQLVPLKIEVHLCAGVDYWPQDLRSILEQEFSDGYTPDGRPGFFHPDLWTFGQALQASQIIGRVQSVQGVDHVISVTMKRLHGATPLPEEVVEVRANEIISVKNDPDHLETGGIFFEILGGRR